MKNKILKGITTITAVLCLLAGSGLNTEGWRNEIICVICLAWLVLFLLANRKRVVNEII